MDTNCICISCYVALLEEYHSVTAIKVSDTILKQRTVETLLLKYDKPISIKFDEADISLKSKIDLISVSIQMLYKEIQ